MTMSSTRWDVGEYVEKGHVFSDHKRERQRDVGAAPTEPQLRHKHFPHHRHWNDHKLLRQTRAREPESDSNSNDPIVVTFSSDS